jgi:hypothetical protein
MPRKPHGRFYFSLHPSSFILLLLVIHPLIPLVLKPADGQETFYKGPTPPPERVKALSEAYVKMMKDPELIAEAKKERMDMDPTTGEELQTLAQQVMDQLWSGLREY